METLEACEEIVNEKLDVRNIIQDSMEFSVIKNAMLRKRHHVLIRLLSVSNAKKHIVKNEEEEEERNKDKNCCHKFKEYFIDPKHIVKHNAIKNKTKSPVGNLFESGKMYIPDLAEQVDDNKQTPDEEIMQEEKQ